MSILRPAYIAQGYASYFICTNKGCDLSVPKALDLKFPNKVPTPYVLTCTFIMPAPTKSGDFSLYFHGEDQYHQPYDFDGTISYNIIM
jgi:hypothetical protein